MFDGLTWNRTKNTILEGSGYIHLTMSPHNHIIAQVDAYVNLKGGIPPNIYSVRHLLQ